MSATTFGWLVLLFPLLGTIVIALGYKRLPGAQRRAGWRRWRSRCLRVRAIGALISLLGDSPSHRELTSTLWNYDVTAGVDAKLQILVDPLSVFMALVVVRASRR